MRENFEAAANNLKEFEGGVTNDPADPGGATMFGISKTYHPNVQFPITWEQAKDIYLADYWIKGGCDSLPFPLDCLHFDAMVNPGPGAAAKFLHDSGEHKDALCRCVEYQALRLRYYLAVICKRPASLKYLAGWSDRTLDLLERTVLTMWSLEGK
jgi:hypothetical protein